MRLKFVYRKNKVGKKNSRWKKYLRIQIWFYQRVNDFDLIFEPKSKIYCGKILGTKSSLIKIGVHN